MQQGLSASKVYFFNSYSLELFQNAFGAFQITYLTIQFLNETELAAIVASCRNMPVNRFYPHSIAHYAPHRRSIDCFFQQFTSLIFVNFSIIELAWSTVFKSTLLPIVLSNSIANSLIYKLCFE
jgi:hypothetical protein